MIKGGHWPPFQIAIRRYSGGRATSITEQVSDVTAHHGVSEWEVAALTRRFATAPVGASVGVCCAIERTLLGLRPLHSHGKALPCLAEPSNDEL